MPDSNEIVVVGADGLLGKGLLNLCKKEGITCVGTTRRQASPGLIPLDLKKIVSLQVSPAGENASAILCAGITSLAACRERYAESYRINVTAVSAIANNLLEQGFRPVLLSSSLVFSGKEQLQRHNDLPSPLTAYGKQKLEAEENLIHLSDKSLVIRLSKVIHPQFPLFHGWLESWRLNAPVLAFHDAFFAPIAVDWVLESVLDLCRSRAKGIWQLSCHEEYSYADAAYALADMYGVSSSLVTPISARERLPKDERPKHPALDCSRFADWKGDRVPNGMSALRWFYNQNPL